MTGRREGGGREGGLSAVVIDVMVMVIVIVTASI